MEVKQIYEILNTITQEVLGEEVVVQEDLSNVVDVGKAFENMDNGFDNYVRKLPDHIGRVVFVNRIKEMRVPNVLRDGWEYGSILEKIRIEMPEAEENQSWSLVDRASYDPNIFYAPKISVRFFNDRTTYELPLSFTEEQIKSSFSNATQMNALYSAIETAITNSITMNTEELIKRTINNFIGETVHSEFSGGSYSSGTGVRAINLLYIFNNKYNKSLTKANCIYDADFIRFMSYYMGLTIDRMTDWSTMFNLGETQKFTPRDKMHFVMLSEVKRAAGAYLYDAQGQFRTDDILLPESETITRWQGTGTDYGFDSTSKIDVKTSGGHEIELDGILAVAFDHDALGVCNEKRRVKTDINNVGEFWTERHKVTAGYWNDFDENFVVFFVA